MPAAAGGREGKRKGGGRAELAGAEREVEEEKVVVGEKVEDKVVDRGWEIDGRGVEGRYGLRPEELDSEGRYVGELHGDGRQQFEGVELQGSEVVR